MHVCTDVRLRVSIYIYTHIDTGIHLHACNIKGMFRYIHIHAHVPSDLHRVLFSCVVLGGSSLVMQPWCSQAGLRPGEQAPAARCDGCKLCGLQSVKELVRCCCSSATKAGMRRQEASQDDGSSN